MKALITNLKSWLVLIVLGTLVLMLVFACSSPPTGQSTTTTTTTGSGDSDDDDDDDESDKDLACALPKCSGSKCCDKAKGKDKERCEDWCGENDFLGLSGNAYKTCLTLSIEFVEEGLVFLFGDKVLEDPDDPEKLLDDVRNDDIDTICAAVKELDADIWYDHLKNYNRSKAKIVAGWIAQEEQTVQIFQKAKKRNKKDYGITMFKKLLERIVGTSSSDAQVLAGLAEEFEFNDDDETKNIVARAVDESNEPLIQFIHKDILQDEKQGICKESNQPNPKGQNTAKSGTTGYNNQESGNNADGGFASAEDNKEEACLLAVYCKISNGYATSPADSENSFRQDLASEINEISSSIRSFIKSDISDGGLGLDASANYEDWNAATCERLKLLWINRSSSFDLGLGSS